MSGLKRFLIIICLVLFVAAGWLAAVFTQSDTEKQKALMDKAELYMDDEIYVKAVPLLEEAITYKGKLTLSAEELLKKNYVALIDKSGYVRKYTNLLNTQMSREDATPLVYREAAEFFLDNAKYEKAFDALKNGIKKTGDEELRAFYEETRYGFKTGRATYQDVTEFFNGMIQVYLDGFWGLARYDGNLVVPCEYDYLSNYYDGELIAIKGGVLSGINLEESRLALYKGDAAGAISNFNEERVALKQSEGWVMATGELTTGTNVFEELRTFSSGGAAAKTKGKWGVISRNGKDYLIEPKYDEIICDDLGRCFYENSVFVKTGEAVNLLVNGEIVGDTYEDAKPFSGGYAAVKKGGKWGYIDMEGNTKIDYLFDDARSFTMHLAPVKKGMNWGYVGLDGEMVIEPMFLDAKSFNEGTAPVKTADGWQFITLTEYKRGIAGI